MPLDSDVPNGDVNLQVEFYEYKLDPYKGVPFVRIHIPGDQTNVYDQPAKEFDKQRFARQWLHFQMKNGDGQVIGTPLVTWHQERPAELTEGQLQELMILKFQSVEQVALATDSQIMRVGMGAAGMRERARTYLSSKNAQASGAELQTAKDEIAELKAMMQQLLAAKTEAPTPKRRGPQRGWKRTPKNKDTVNVQHDDAATGATDGG